MDRLPFTLILFILTIVLVGNVIAFAGYKWIPLNSGDPIPENSIGIDYFYAGFSPEKYVGRARHYDNILPAEVTASGTASVSYCGKEIIKYQFEILTSTPGTCDWKTFYESENQEVNKLRVGTAWTNEPIFIGISKINQIVSVYLNSNKTFHWLQKSPYSFSSLSDIKYLCCNMEAKWIEHSPSMEIPNNAVYFSEKDETNRFYVARIKRDCDWIIGQFRPEDKTAKGYLYAGTLTESRYFDVLIGEPDEYDWVLTEEGKIPEYAVVQARIRSQPVYVAQAYTSIRGLTQLETVNTFNCKILVMKQKY